MHKLLSCIEGTLWCSASEGQIVDTLLSHFKVFGNLFSKWQWFYKRPAQLHVSFWRKEWERMFMQGWIQKGMGVRSYYHLVELCTCSELRAHCLVGLGFWWSAWALARAQVAHCFLPSPFYFLFCPPLPPCIQWQGKGGWMAATFTSWCPESHSQSLYCQLASS